MAVLNKQDFFEKRGLNTVDVEVEALGGSVRLRELSAGTAEELADSEDSNFRRGLLSLLYSIVDEQGEPVFTVEDYDVLAGYGMSVLEPLIKAMNELNGEDVDVAVADLDSTPEGDSPTS